jgi:hypothetical protein
MSLSEGPDLNSRRRRGRLPKALLTACDFDLISGFWFRVWGFWFRVSISRFRISGFELRVSGFEFQVTDFGFRVEVSGFGLTRSEEESVRSPKIGCESGSSGLRGCGGKALAGRGVAFRSQGVRGEGA